MMPQQDSETNTTTLSHHQGNEIEVVVNVTMGITLSLLVTISILGNMLVITAIWTDKTLRKLSNLFFISLAVADLLLSALVMPFAIVNDLLGEWIFGKEYCNLWIAMDVMCCTASITSLLAISLERYIHIKDPLQYTEWLTRKSVPLTIVVIWLVSALISFLPISLGLHSPREGSESPSLLSDEEQHSSKVTLLPQHLLPSINKTQDAQAISSSFQPRTVPGDEMLSNSSMHEGPQCQVDFSPIYSITSSIVSFFLPCIIMVVIYFHLFAIAKRHLNEMRAHSRPLIRLRLLNEHLEQQQEQQQQVLQDGGLNLSKQNSQNKGQQRKRKHVMVTLSDSPLLQEHKAAITIGIIMGVFLLCWMPFFIVNVVAGFCKDCISVTSFKVLTWLGYSNSAFNPIIYTIFNAEFRGAFGRVLTRLGHKICTILQLRSNEANDYYFNKK